MSCTGFRSQGHIHPAGPFIFLLAIMGFRADAQVLGTASDFAVLAGTTVTNTGSSVITGDVGVSPGTAITGFPPGVIVPPGIMAMDTALAMQAHTDLISAYNASAALTPTQNLTGQDLGGLILTPGVYFFSSSAQLTGTLTLNDEGNPNAEFVFQIGSTLTTASDSNVITINGGTAPGSSVYWQVGSSATLGTGTAFEGNILAETSITLDTAATILDGSALAINGAVTLDDNTIDDEPAGTPIPEPLPYAFPMCLGLTAAGVLLLQRGKTLKMRVA